MDASLLISQNRYLADHFNRDEYPSLFCRVKDMLDEYFSELPSDTIEALNADVSSILSEVERNMEAQRFKFRKESVFADDHIVLSLFVAPAAARIGTSTSLRFANLLSESWESRFPGSRFKVGDYDEIMEGFKWKITLSLK